MLSKRTLSGASYALSYDYDDQLTGTGGASFAYDAAGRRVSRTAGGVTTSFLYDGESVLLEQQGGATTASYSYGNALTRKDGETPLFDGQGSERTVTNTAGAVQATLTLSAFGQAVASSGGSSDPYQYAATSRYRSDGDAGLALVGCRYYDAQVGQFVTRDTYLDQKPYAYCDGDPVNATDPDGHDPSRQQGVPYPFPGNTEAKMGGSGGIDVKVFKIDGSVDSPINLVDVWKKRVPLHDKRILAKKGYDYFLWYVIKLEADPPPPNGSLK